MNILFRNFTVLPMADDPVVLKNTHVLVKDGKIAYIGPDLPDDPADEVIDGAEDVLLPGLINAHSHSPMTALRGFADGYDLHTWLNEHIFPAERKLTAECVSAAADIALMEMMASGTTSFSDMYMFSDVIADRTERAGMKLNISTGLVAFDPDFVFEKLGDMQQLRLLMERYPARDKIRPEASVHAEYTSGERAWREVANFAHSHGLRVQLHLSETESEHANCIEKYGETPLGCFLRTGILESPVTAAHAVWCSEGDLDLMKRFGVVPVHNPISNQKLASGVAPVPAMLKLGIPVALGTDGAASNNALDLFAEMKSAAMLQGAVSRDATLVPPYEVLKMATRYGALAQGRENECGQIKEGFDADLIVVDFDKPHLIPCYDVVSNLVFSARGSDVSMNMVRGQIIYRNGEFKTVDFERAKHEIKRVVVPLLRDGKSSS